MPDERPRVPAPAESVTRTSETPRLSTASAAMLLSPGSTPSRADTTASRSAKPASRPSSRSATPASGGSRVSFSPV